MFVLNSSAKDTAVWSGQLDERGIVGVFGPLLNVCFKLIGEGHSSLVRIDERGIVGVFNQNRVLSCSLKV